MDDTAEMACRGCAAKLPAAPLERALQQAGIGNLGAEPEDAAVLPVRADVSWRRCCRAWMGSPP